MLKGLGHNVEIMEKSTTSTPETQGAGLAVAVDLRKYLQEYDRTQTPYGVSRQSRFSINQFKG